MNKEDIHNAAEKNLILWDDDPIFKMICRQLTGKECLDKMAPKELKLVYEEITLNPAVFSKRLTDEAKDFYFKQNYDYESGDFLDKVRKRLRNKKR